jgi:hypothetical protein
MSLPTIKEQAESEWFNIRAVAANNPKCPASILEKLADDSSDYVLHSVIKNPNSNHAIQNKAFKKIALKKDQRIQILKNYNLAPEIKQQILFAKDLTHFEKVNIVRDKLVDVSFFKESKYFLEYEINYSWDYRTLIRLVIENYSLDKETFEYIWHLNWQTKHVCLADLKASSTRHLNAELILNLFQDIKKEADLNDLDSIKNRSLDELIGLIICHPKTPLSIFEELKHVRSYSASRAFLKSKYTPESLIKEFFVDDYFEPFKEELLKHPNCPKLYKIMS